MLENHTFSINLDKKFHNILSDGEKKKKTLSWDPYGINKLYLGHMAQNWNFNLEF